MSLEYVFAGPGALHAFAFHDRKFQLIVPISTILLFGTIFLLSKTSIILNRFPKPMPWAVQTSDALLSRMRACLRQ